MFDDFLSNPPGAPPRAATEPRLAGRLLAGRFQVTRFLARGGMGDVYEAEDLELGGHIAIKVIRPDLAANAAVLAQLKHEVQAARLVSHPNVCRVFDLEKHSGEQGEIAFLTMQLLEGETLAHRLKRTGPFTAAEALPLIKQMASALEAAHEAGVIHRDFKPGNVMLVPANGNGPRAVVTDFGLAVPSPATGSDDLTSVWPVAGTPEYMAPEQRQGGPVSEATDVYALGRVVEEMAGSAAWRPVLDRCLAGDPRKRYQRAADVVGALRDAARPRVFPLLGWLTAAPLGAAALWMLLSASPPSKPAMAISRQIGDAKAGGWEKPSPDGRTLAITSWKSMNLALFDIATGRMTELTHGAGWAPGQGVAAPGAFSKSGDRIAFEWDLVSGSSECRVIGIRGADNRLLYTHPNLIQCAPVDWSTDDRRVLLRLGWRDYTNQFAIAPALGGTVHLLGQPSKILPGRTLFAPDGEHLVFDAPKQITCQNIATGRTFPLMRTPGQDHIAGWSPDHRRLLFLSDRTGAVGLWQVPVSSLQVNGDPELLRPDIGRIWPVGISRQGALFYSGPDASVLDVYVADLNLDRGEIVSLPRQMTGRRSGVNGFPSWSPDGKRLSFVAEPKGEKTTLVIAAPATGEIRELQTPLTALVRPQWQGGGDWLVAFGVDAGGRTAYFRLNAVSGDATFFRDPAEMETTFEGVFSADGKTWFNRFAEIHRGFFRLDLATGRRRILYVPPPPLDHGLENLALSPDEKWLAFQVRNRAAGHGFLTVIPAEGGPARTLMEVQSPEEFLFGAFTWLPDSRRILVARTANDISQLWVVSLDGAPPRQIPFPRTRVNALRLNRDGRTIAFHTPKRKSELWVMENFLPPAR